MNWLGSIYLLFLLCGLVWMLVKIQRLSGLKNRLRRTTVHPSPDPLYHNRRSKPSLRGRSKHCDKED
ncbi:hypothetical protein AV903_22485 [Erwinia tracheiphila]|uniref:High mobility group protein Z n=1 Tax=Erwinia tracheiphila TaxID=65700 RepID=A0A345CXI3_9GAMM|nr:hypothetical protein AV903_22485 [Erwinia tracheiphila]